jgi:hypothetical protein
LIEQEVEVASAIGGDGVELALLGDGAESGKCELLRSGRRGGRLSLKRRRRSNEQTQNNGDGGAELFQLLEFLIMASGRGYCSECGLTFNIHGAAAFSVS